MRELDALSALSPGSTLWLIPPLEESAWSKRIDWYLGFQLRRGLPHRRFDFSDDMRQLMEAFEETLPRIPRTEDSPLMIASSNLLPNHQTVLIPKKDDVRTWILAAHQVWRGLGQPPARVFLPKGLTPTEFEKQWPVSQAAAVEDFDLQLVTSI